MSPGMHLPTSRKNVLSPSSGQKNRPADRGGMRLANTLDSRTPRGQSHVSAYLPGLMVSNQLFLVLFRFLLCPRRLASGAAVLLDDAIGVQRLRSTYCDVTGPSGLEVLLRCFLRPAVAATERRADSGSVKRLFTRNICSAERIWRDTA
jgi:hypothetical protein